MIFNLFYLIYNCFTSFIFFVIILVDDMLLLLYVQMSAGSQIQMAPQAGLMSGGQPHPQQQQAHSQDSNLSTGRFALALFISYL